MRIYHLSGSQKHRENSLRGIRYAARHGYDAVDLDMLITSDDVIVGTHWDRPIRREFRDPQRKIDASRTVRSLTWEQVSRLRAGRWPRRYRIQRIERLLRACARHGIVAYLEPKDDKRFEAAWPWQEIRKAADACGAHVMVRSIEDFGGNEAGVRRVKAAERFGGFQGRVIQ